MITTINLSSLDLEGQPDVGALETIPGLKAISIQNNSLAGPMPEINRLRSIKAFYADNNWFSGVIRSDFFQTLGSLKKLWLQHNNFSGQIPKSVGELPNLKELHLEYNEFSGKIPEFPEADIITMLDLSNNRLQGEIPKSLMKFDKKVFENNADLCGEKLSKECKTHSKKDHDQFEQPTETKSSVKWIIMIVVVVMLILIILARANQIEQDNRPLGKGGIDEAVVNIPTVTKKSTSHNNNNNNNNSNNIYSSGSSSSNNSNSNTNSNSNSNNSNVVKKDNKESSTRSRKGGTQTVGGKSVGDLVMVNEERGVFGLQDLMKAAAEVLGNGGLGSAYKAMLGNGVSVVVKRVREMNQMTKEVFDAEMKKLAKLKHQNILTPLAYHFRKEEKLLVSEYVPNGSLLYVLHGIISILPR